MEELHEAAVGIGPLQSCLDRLGQLGRLWADEEELGEGVADQQVLLYGEIGVLGRQLTAFREDLHQTAGKEVELVAVVDETEQVAVASRIGRNARLLQDLVVGPANPLGRLQLPEIRQGIDLVELLLGIAVDERQPQSFQTTEQRNGDGDQGGFEGAGGTHPEHVDGFALAQLLLQGELIEIEVDPLQLVGLSGTVECQLQQLELVFAVEVVDRSAGDLDGERLRLCQQRQAQTQLDEPFHALISCRVRDLPGV